METIRAISLWQPWASMVVLGTKKVETRHWNTLYRGPLLIHAAKRRVQSELATWNAHPSFHAIGEGNARNLAQSLPFGAIIGLVTMVDCRNSEDFYADELYAKNHTPDGIGHWSEGELGNYADGRFGWVFANAVKFDEPIPYKGKQGFFNVPLLDLAIELDLDLKARSR